MLFDQIRDEPAVAVDKTIKKQKSRRQWKTAAAVLLIVGVLSLFAVILADSWNSQKFVQTKPGEQQTLLLPDNSKIVLHGNSSLEYSSTFGKREVTLKGEAYFEVEHNKEKPFVVYVDNSYVKVLGTKFVVSGYYGGERVEVAVKSGRVELGLNNNEVTELEARAPEDKKDKPIEITDAQVGIQNQNSHPFIADSKKYEELFDWVEGKMVFRDAPLKYVVAELENRYGVECVVTDPDLGKQKFTSSFDNETLPEVLKVLTLSLGIRYKRIGDKIYLSH
jgi:ferric-dicitrate binding protein FerR (iron transport regulator)